MNAEGGQVGYLVESAVVAYACVSVELEFGDVAIGTCAAHVANIAETAADVYVCSGGCIGSRPFANEIEGYGVHEVGTVCTLEQTKERTVCTLPSGSRSEAYAGDDMRFAKIETHPSECGGIGAVIGRCFAVESSLCLCLCAGTDYRTFEKVIGGRIIGIEGARTQQK